jgi:cytochrome c oxidase cbb3-type subunit 4
MNFTYEEIAAFSQQTGLVYFFLIFLAVVVFAVWPKNKANFDHAAQIPFQED